jgi:hypothetical protein
MKIKYEKEVKDCSECDLFFNDIELGKRCCIDGKSEFVYLVDNERFLPCQQRPCPIQVKDKKKLIKTCANCNRVPCMKRMDMLNKGIDSDSVQLGCWER